MKITVSEFKNVVREAYKDGFFQEVTEDILNDDSQLDEVLKVFISELKKKRVIRGKKLVKKVVCGKGKRYDAKKKNVAVILQGACSGCPSSTFTLKNGIENMLKEMLHDHDITVEAING